MGQTEMSITQHEVSEAIKWTAMMGERGIYGGASARIRATAVESLTSILAQEEPRTVSWILENLEAIATRWAQKNLANPDTAATYRSRARSTLEDFLRFQQDPMAFKPKVRVVANEPAKKAERKPAKEAGSEKAEPKQEATPAAPSAALRSYPLGEGAEFRFEIPAAGLKMKDVARIFGHLATFAADFDPTGNADHGHFFALPRPEQK